MCGSTWHRPHALTDDDPGHDGEKEEKQELSE